MPGAYEQLTVQYGKFAFVSDFFLQKQYIFDNMWMQYIHHSEKEKTDKYLMGFQCIAAFVKFVINLKQDWKNFSLQGYAMSDSISISKITKTWSSNFGC